MPRRKNRLAPSRATLAEPPSLMEKINFEESKSKDVLDEKLKLEQELLDLKEDLAVKFEKQHHNRDDLIKLRVKDSQLESQDL